MTFVEEGGWFKGTEQRSQFDGLNLDAIPGGLVGGVKRECNDGKDFTLWERRIPS
jgi:hypothetical protein